MFEVPFEAEKPMKERDPPALVKMGHSKCEKKHLKLYGGMAFWTH
jgi:hypothetical protein